MNKLKPIHLNNGVIEIHPLRKKELLKNELVCNDLFEIFGDKESLPYNYEKLVKGKEDITNQLLGVTFGYENQTRYTHFLTLSKIDKVIGEIIILSPKSASDNYRLKETWVIEFYLNKHLWNNGIMTDALKAILQNMKEQGINKIGALVDRKNYPSIKVLEKVGFKKDYEFDLRQDYYKF
jgi:RimJ/RimL family protein N-acetyltransferase